MITEEIQKQFKVFHSLKHSNNTNNPRKSEGNVNNNKNNNEIYRNENFFILNGSTKSLGKAPVNKFNNLHNDDWDNSVTVGEKGNK